MRFRLAALALFLSSCASDPRPLDGPTDADDAVVVHDTPDAGQVDAGGVTDARSDTAPDVGAPADAPADVGLALDAPDVGTAMDVADAGGGGDAPDALTSPDVGLDAGAMDVGADVARLDVVDAPETGVDAGTDVRDAGTDNGPDVGADAGPLDTGPADVGLTDTSTDTSTDTGPDVVDAGPPDVGTPCVPDSVRCNVGGSSVERCVGGAWTVLRTCGLSAGDEWIGFCEASACRACRRGDGGITSGCGASTCSTDEDCYRQRLGRCVAGQCGRRGILPCSTPPDCLPWIVTGVTSACTSSGTDSNGDAVQACTGNSLLPCTVDAMCPANYRCDLRTGRCATL